MKAADVEALLGRMGNTPVPNVLAHAGTYDPIKSREYYLRTRKLKGRQPAKAAPLSSPGEGGRPVASGPKPSREKTNSRQAELKAQRAALEKRLERLREVLSELVEAAQGRSGVKDTPAEKKAQAEKAAADTKADKKLTPKQKREKAKQAREEYEKSGGSSLSNDVAELKRQVQAIQKRIKDALDDAQDKAYPTKGPRNTLGQPTSLSGGQQNLTLDGPRGRRSTIERS